MATSLTQFGVTWTFDGDYTTGQYANGDYYVVAPSGLTITDISPASTETELTSSAVTISNASPCVIGWTGHGLRANTLVRFSTTDTLPSPLVAGQAYFVISAGLGTDSFRISATPSSAPGVFGSAINTTTAGSGTLTGATYRVKNGAMTNLATGFSNYLQGFDSAMYGTTATPGPFYSPSLNVARPNDADLSAGNPLDIAAGTSLVSCVSESAASTGATRVQLTDTAVLTVVSAAPSANSFRPPFFGADKTHSWNKSDLDYSVFQSLPAVSGTPSLATVEGDFAYPWWTAYFQCGSFIQNTSTSRNPTGMSGLYGREVAHAVSDAVLSLHLDYSNAQKETLLVRLVQFGLDVYGAVAFASGEWKDNAGILNGCKLPLLVAGMALDDANIKAWADAAQHKVFSEDLQTWYVTEADVGRVMSQANFVRETYITADIGIAEAGQQHTRTPNLDGRNWDDPYMPYRDIIGASHFGNCLGARLITGGQAAWNWEPFFDYTDRYELDPINDLGSPIQAFHQNMWDAYRGGLPPLSPTSLTATAVSVSAINLSWADASDDETGFRVERSLNGSTGWEEIGTPGAGITFYSDTGLASSTQYYYRVRAYNTYGNSSYSNTANDTTDAAPVLGAGLYPTLPAAFFF